MPSQEGHGTCLVYQQPNQRRQTGKPSGKVQSRASLQDSGLSCPFVFCATPCPSGSTPEARLPPTCGLPGAMQQRSAPTLSCLTPRGQQWGTGGHRQG